ncbi:hypothetical protein WJX73_010237 [Symbiochloris irregularis]|uniref:Uncharacterized protein n=1 Tax=Symbiochloris irregularis TaxID=706552 RepID=A0AAW1NRI3_9CHLO
MLLHSFHTCQGRSVYARPADIVTHTQSRHNQQSRRPALSVTGATAQRATALTERQASGGTCCTSPRCSSQSSKASRSDAHASDSGLEGWQKLARQGIALSLALLAFGCAPECSALETVAPSEALAAARPLPQNPKVDKGRVWLVFVGGAVTLFGGTVLLERFEGLFPAIAKANKVLAGYAQEAEVSCLLSVAMNVVLHWHCVWRLHGKVGTVGTRILQLVIPLHELSAHQ